MSQVSDEELIRMQAFCKNSTGITQRPHQIITELLEARAEIKRIKGLSDSQAETLDKMDRGAL